MDLLVAKETSVFLNSKMDFLKSRFGRSSCKISPWKIFCHSITKKSQLTRLLRGESHISFRTHWVIRAQIKWPSFSPSRYIKGFLGYLLAQAQKQKSTLKKLLIFFPKNKFAKFQEKEFSGPKIKKFLILSYKKLFLYFVT